MNIAMERPSEIATLLNPAFCSTLIYAGVREFHSERNEGVSYIFPFLLLPLILHTETRDKLPRSNTTTLSSWLTNQSTAIVKVGFAQRARSMSPYVKEALIFATQHKVLHVHDDGKLYIGNEIKITQNSSMRTSDLSSCLKAAKLCGSLIAHSGDIKTVMTLLGVQP